MKNVASPLVSGMFPEHMVILFCFSDGVFFSHFKDVPFGLFVKLQNPLLLLKCCKAVTVSCFQQLLCEMPWCMCGMNAGSLLTP